MLSEVISFEFCFVECVSVLVRIIVLGYFLEFVLNASVSYVKFLTVCCPEERHALEHAVLL